jgi:hypothetical protein
MSDGVDEWSVEEARRERMWAALGGVEGLRLEDCLQFFSMKATQRDDEITDMCPADSDEFAIDYICVSETEHANGAYVLGWRWVDFAGTTLDKTTRRGKLLFQFKAVWASVDNGTIAPDDLIRFLDECKDAFAAGDAPASPSSAS